MCSIRGCLLGLVVLSVFPASSQTAAPDSTSQQTTFRANVRRVLVDVVVTNSKDEPVTGLPREQFQVFEDGQPQVLTSFEEHSGLPDMSALQAKLPPNTFSNLPLAKAGDAANILLLDALNTQMSDQSYVHAQMIKYIKGIRPGTRLAIFTLAAQLRFVQGFTGDPAVLMAAVNGQKSAGNPQLSPLLQTSTQIDADNRGVAQMEEMAASSGSAQIQASANALREFQQETVSSQTDVRVKTTLEAMQQLARYVQAIPGRKNVIWFSGSFPLTILGNLGSGQDFQEELEKTANMLSAAQVAIYPVGAQGLAPDRQFDFSGPQPPKIASVAAEQQMTQYQTSDLQTGMTQRNAATAAMDDLARNTGGEAFYNTNGLNDALERVLNHGTHYYTLSYSPPTKNMDGRLRHIEVKVSGATYRLSYRRGYYAKDQMFVQSELPKPNGDPLRPLMDHGTPDSTAVLYTMRVLPASPQPAPGGQRAGDNENLKGPVTRYCVAFAVSADHLTLDPAPDGVRHGNLEVTLLGYDRDGKPLNWMVRMLQLTLPPDRYAVAQARGVSFALEIDVPTAAVYLRSGVLDQGSSRAGTLEIPLAAVVAQVSAPK
jgi:VWFA-related protein